MKLLATFAFLFLLSGALTYPQQGQTPIPGSIDGRTHPELIPDSIAYRLFFEAVSEPSSATVDMLRRQRAKLRVVALQEADLNTINDVLAQFHDQHEQLKSDYNNAAAAALKQGNSFDVGAWQARRDTIVESAHQLLKQRLTPLGLQRLEAHILSRKADMMLFPPPSMAGHAH